MDPAASYPAASFTTSSMGSSVLVQRGSLWHPEEQPSTGQAQGRPRHMVQGQVAQCGRRQGEPSGDPQLIALRMEQLKNLFDSFHRSCLANMDVKPAYQVLRQKVDTFVSTPHLDKQ